MSIPPLSELEVAAKKVVWAALKNGNLEKFTARLVRHAIEEQYSLEEGTLDTAEYKFALREAVKTAVDEKPPESEDEEEQTTKKKVKKNKSEETIVVRKPKKGDVTPAPSKTKGKRKENSTNEDENEDGSVKKKRRVSKAIPKEPLHDGMDYEDEDTPKKKTKPVASTSKEVLSDNEAAEETGKNKRKPSVSKATKEESDDADGPRQTSSKSKQTKASKTYKSLEHVPTSDMEQDEPGPISIIGPSEVVDSTILDDRDGKKPPSQPKLGPSTLKSKLKAKSTQAYEKPTSKTKAKHTPVESEPESPIEDIPKKKKNSPVEKKAPIAKQKEKRSSKSESLNKDEETIKKLKSLVNACGTRKVWSKELEGLDTPQKQIKKIKLILTDLGMTGRMSLEQAKAIKQRRDLAKELEDVQEFERKMISRSSGRNEEDSEHSESQKEDSDDDVGPIRKATNARKSIMDFLKDQTDEE